MKSFLLRAKSINISSNINNIYCWILLFHLLMFAPRTGWVQEQRVSNSSVNNRATFSTILKDHFEEKRSSYDLDNVKVILLSDLHIDSKQSLHRKDLIKSLIQRTPGKYINVVLLESYDISEVLTPEQIIKLPPWDDEELKDQIILGGWDNVELVDQSCKVVKDLMHKFEERSDLENSDCDHPTDPYWKDWQMAILNQMCNDLYDQFHEVGIKKRNEGLIKTLQTILQHSSRVRIFVIAGKLHFNQQVLSFLDDHQITFSYYYTLPTQNFDSKVTDDYAKSLTEDIPENRQHGTLDNLLKVISQKESALNFTPPTGDL